MKRVQGHGSRVNMSYQIISPFPDLRLTRESSVSGLHEGKFANVPKLPLEQPAHMSKFLMSLLANRSIPQDEPCDPPSLESRLRLILGTGVF